MRSLQHVHVALSTLVVLAGMATATLAVPVSPDTLPIGGLGARQKLAEGKIAEDLGHHSEAREIFSALSANSDTPLDVACEALIRQASVTWQHVNVAEGIALLKASRERCSFDKEAMRLLVSVVTGVEQDADTWRGRSEDFFVAIIDSPRGPEPIIAFTDDPGRDPFSSSLAETPASGRAWRGEPVSLQVKDAQLMDVFRLLHEVSGLNMVVEPAIGRRTITLDLVDVPWDQMLALILQTQGLAASVSGNVMRIGSLDHLSAERFAGSDEDLARQQETLRSLRSVALSVAARRGTKGSWPICPQVRDVALLAQDRGFFSGDVPSRDEWGNPLRYWSDGKLLRIASPGSDGIFEHPDLAGYVPTVARHPGDDLIWQDDAPLTALVSAR